MRGCGLHRPHFVQDAVEAGVRDLPGSFRARESAAEDVDGGHCNQDTGVGGWGLGTGG